MVTGAAPPCWPGLRPLKADRWRHGWKRHKPSHNWYAAARSGDAAAWEEIVQRFHRRIYNLCYRFAGSAEDAQDLTQEVFIKVYRTVGSFDGEKASFNTWVTAVTRNLLVDHFRKTRNERATDSIDAVQGGKRMGQPWPIGSPRRGTVRRFTWRAGSGGRWCIGRCRRFRRICARR